MAITGLNSRLLTNLANGADPQNWRQGIFRFAIGGSAPLFALTNGMRTRRIRNKVFNWWSEEEEAYRFQIPASTVIGAADTTITLTGNATLLSEGDLLKAEHSGEVMRVTGVVSDTQVTVARGFAGTTAAAIDTNPPPGANNSPYLFVVGSAFEEYSSAVEARYAQPVQFTNYIETFRHAYAISNDTMESELRTGDEARNERQRALHKHSVAIERALWFGVPSTQQVNGRDAYTTGGIIYFIEQYAPQNIWDGASKTLDMTQLENILADAFMYGSQEKVLFCGQHTALTIQRAIRKNTSWQLLPGQQEFGMVVSRLVTTNGTLVIKTHPLFNAMKSDFTNNFYGHDTWGVIVDMDKLRYVVFANNDVRFRQDIGEKRLDGRMDEYISKIGLQVDLPKAFYLLKNVVNAGVDA